MHKTKVVPPESHAQGSCGAWRGREAADPVDYKHPYPSMAQYAELLALRFDAKRTRHAYYRAMRVLHEHFQCDPATLEESHLRDYLLHIKLQKHWKPKTIRQTLACAKLFFVELLQRPLWRVFSQIRTKDHDFLPAVLTRQQVHNLLGSIRLRRYRTPIKLIYCCGLRLGECLSLTIHDILGDERRLVIRNSKGHQDRVIPLPALMLEDLRKFWSFHRHPRWLFPNVGRGDQTPQALTERMRSAKTPVPYSSLQRLIIVARKQLNLPAASPPPGAPNQGLSPDRRRPHVQRLGPDVDMRKQLAIEQDALTASATCGATLPLVARMFSLGHHRGVKACPPYRATARSCAREADPRERR